MDGGAPNVTAMTDLGRRSAGDRIEIDERGRTAFAWTDERRERVLARRGVF